MSQNSKYIFISGKYLDRLTLKKYSLCSGVEKVCCIIILRDCLPLDCFDTIVKNLHNCIFCCIGLKCVIIALGEMLPNGGVSSTQCLVFIMYLLILRIKYRSPELIFDLFNILLLLHLSLFNHENNIY